jgi:hypothetical protein
LPFTRFNAMTLSIPGRQFGAPQERHLFPRPLIGLALH